MSVRVTQLEAIAFESLVRGMVCLDNVTARSVTLGSYRFHTNDSYLELGTLSGYYPRH